MMTLEEAEKRTEEARAYLHIDEKKAELANLDSRIANPDFWNDTDNAQQVSKQASDIRDVIERYESACASIPPMQFSLSILVAVAWRLRIGLKCCIACIHATPILRAGRSRFSIWSLAKASV